MVWSVSESAFDPVWRGALAAPGFESAPPTEIVGQVLGDFADAYNFAKRLKTLRGLTPYEFIRKAWASDPTRFKISPLQKMPGLNS